jgi:hypothetical protein
VEETAMAALTEPQRRFKAHFYASLREHIIDELKYDRLEDFPEGTLDGEAFNIQWNAIHEERNALMMAVHPVEAAAMDAPRL